MPPLEFEPTVTRYSGVGAGALAKLADLHADLTAQNADVDPFA